MNGGRLGLVLGIVLLGACSSPAPRSGARDGAAAGSAATGSGAPAAASSRTDAAPASTSSRTDAPAARRPAGRSSVWTVDPGDDGATTSGGASGGESPRATRGRLVEAARDEERPAGSSEAKVESEGATYRAGVGLMPKYEIRRIERKDPPPPPDEVLRLVPGSRIDLPPPDKPERPEPANVGEPVPPTGFGPKSVGGDR